LTLIDRISITASIVDRQPTILPLAKNEYEYEYTTLELGEIDLSFAGRYYESNRVHHNISALNQNDILFIQLKEDKYELYDSERNIVGRLSKKYFIPVGKKIKSVKVFAIICRKKEDSIPEYIDNIRKDRWEVVVPEIIYEPDDTKIMTE